jgi:hypothetical protein
MIVLKKDFFERTTGHVEQGWVALNQQAIVHFSMEMRVLIIICGQVCSYIKELGEQIRGWSVLMSCITLRGRWCDMN